MRPVFLSYAWEDEQLADRLELQLRLRGVPAWRDRHDMRWGAYNEEIVLEAIERCCSGFVLLLSDAVMQSRFILRHRAARDGPASQPRSHVFRRRRLCALGTNHDIRRGTPLNERHRTGQRTRLARRR